MRILRIFLAVVCVSLLAGSALAAHTQAQLILADDTAKPGETVMVGVQLKMDPGWHTYWKNPGSAGMATKIDWQLPAGVTAGEIIWPLPEKLPPDEVVTYAYQNEVVLLVPLKLAADLKPGPLALKAKLSWLECKEQCVPAGATVQGTLNVGTETKPSANAALIQSWEGKTPGTNDAFSIQAHWEKTADEDTRNLTIAGVPILASGAVVEKVEFFPDASDSFEVQGATEKLEAKAGFALRKVVKKFSGEWPTNISGLIVIEGDKQERSFEINVPVASEAAAVSAPPSSSVTSPAGAPVATVSEKKSLGQMLFYAFVGGLILNIMPCVLPVIALKILGFVKDAANDRGRLRQLGFVYLLGVLASFLILAVLVIALKAAGSRVGWGFQFNNPYFLVAMTTLVMLIALNLFGVFEVTLGGRTMTAAMSLTSKGGTVGAFFNGLLATALATSCTAPYLGSAVGFAFAQPPWVIVLIMLTVGIGLAFPYVLLSWEPAWLKFLPKPGAWMEKFKIAMGFPMLAAAVWLCSLLTTFYGERTWSLAIFLVIIALAFWVYGEFVQRGTRRRGLGGVVVLVLVAIGYFYGLEHQLHWREPLTGVKETSESSVTPSVGNWSKWSADAVARARGEGKLVLVDFTAKWCLTCQKDVRPVLESDAVQEKLKQLNAVTLVGDYTRFPSDIFDELARFGRAGVPLVLVYPKNSSEPPIVLPEALTKGIVLSALEQAGK